ncbi:RNA polymerase sigma factor [Steroidobacter sp.]|uniref:RNA polymerase sigma factor n=1 Tax=Steroidobacter sp. TaxID=1978227 RepID=UPI001A371409|nr:sigma-70 family RNA polymerase sigma factor [Steroidobacter sp.]MBL8268167.1 sigma-70 family RNA polymerase sigma factor [Steroidobacter sp.]
MPDSPVTRLFRSQGKRVRSFLRRRLRSHEDAQDATQNVFLGLLRRENAGALEENPRSYMIKAAYNAATDVQRARISHQVDDHCTLDDNIAGNERTEASEIVYWREGLRLFVTALNELPDLTQQVFVLYHVEGLSHTTIAQTLNLSVRSVERHMARAIAHCQDRLKDYLR